MTRVCLDTSAYSWFQRGAPAVVRIIGTARFVGVPVIVLGELRTGFQLGSQPDKNEQEIQAFLSHPVVRVLKITDDTTLHYADIVCELRRAGTPIPTNDIWIAALAAQEGATIITYDRHFESIKRVGSRILAK